MSARISLRILPLLALSAMPLLAGCLLIPITIAGATEGIHYTLASTAYRSLTYPQAQVHTATLEALKKMQIVRMNNKKVPDGIEIQAKTKQLRIDISLTSVTPKVTKISVSAKKNIFVKDRTVAVEIITQVAQILGSR